MAILIADSGSTKCEWCIVEPRKETTIFTQGMSPYFLTADQMGAVIQQELLPQMKNKKPEAVFFYGTGQKDQRNARSTRKMLQSLFPDAFVEVEHDLLGAARALCGTEKGIASILGTGCNSCYFNGKKIMKNSPGLGYILGDEGSGTYLGRKVIQYRLYEIFDAELRDRFDAKYRTNADEILEHVYLKPLPNRYLASFTRFLSENRGHYMVENIIEDGLNDFFLAHLVRYPESSKHPLHFTGAIAYHFRDVLSELCDGYGFELGTVLQNPMEGLIRFHRG